MNKHFTLVVVGENPDKLVQPFDNNIKVEPYVVYEFSKAKEYHDKYIKYYEELLKNDLDDNIKRSVEEQLEFYKSLDDIGFYVELTDGQDLDEETGNMLSDKNPNGKYDTCRLGKELSMPMIDKNGNETFSARKCDIAWDKIHLANKLPYELAWDMVMGDRKPETDDEKNIYENMKNRTEYFSYFGNRETYVNSSTAFWGYAFLDQNGWVELDDNVSQNDWVINFYDRFIKDLPDDALISIYECFRK